MPDFINEKTHFNYDFLNAKECLNILTSEEKNELVSAKTDIEFKAGETIVKRGLLASNVLYITGGLVKLEIVNDKKSATIALINSHSFIGIVCCFAFKKFDFTATALETTKVSFIDMSVFERFITTNGAFSLALIKHMSGTSNMLLHRITRFSQKNIEGALAILLLDFVAIYNSKSFTIPVVRQELAAMLGYSKESVINTLSKFNKEGLIKLNDRKIEILKPKKLEQISKIG